MLNKKQAEDIFKYRITVSNNYEKLINARKSSEKANLSSQGQLNMFDMGLDDPKENIELVEYEDSLNVFDLINVEKDLLGMPMSYSPLEELQMYEDLYCTHKVTDLFGMNTNTKNIVIMDYITEIDYRYSLKGNRYAKIHVSNFGNDNYFYLFSKAFEANIHKLFINEVYLLQIEYKEPTPAFSRDSFVITNIKNVKDIEIEEEYVRIINNLQTISSLDEKWMLKNRKSK